ncbi:hypothetical protein PR048_021502 [Dryococelus australis]|uniref:Uncharacterized protein n=1 Tax=Dryococelus australis TaxID=614101 RepID=A0ABQ9GYD8_9NEOP|nr:hypothetical protein PR048_021502 [Dryococelus australis]
MYYLQCFFFLSESQDSESKRSSQVDSSSELSELCSSPEKAGPSKSVGQLQVKGTEPAELKKLDSLTSYKSENVVLQNDIISSEEDQDGDLGVSSHDPLLQVARDFMLENSSLTQEQILSVIKNQDIPDKSTEAKPEIISLVLQSENLIDKKRIDSENLGVTQKEILALIQAELVRCKELLESDSKGRLGEGTSTTEDDGMISFSKSETLKPDFSCLSAVAEINTNAKITEDLQTTKPVNATQDLQTITAVSTPQDLQAITNVNTTGDMQTITTIITTKGMQTDESFSPEKHISSCTEGGDNSLKARVFSPDKHISSCTEGGDNSLKNGHIEMVVKTNIPAEDVSSDVDTDNDFIEVTEEQVNHSVVSQKDACKQNSSISPVLKTAVTAGNDIFADVFSSADTKKLDEIVGKLKTPYQVASKKFDVGSCVSNAAIEETVTSNKSSLEKSFESDLQSRSVEKMCDLTDFSVEDIENKQYRVTVSTEDRIKNIPVTVNRNEEEVPVYKPAEKLNLQELQALQAMEKALKWCIAEDVQRLGHLG